MSTLEKPCKVWTRATNDAGYGQRQAGGRVQYVHRLTWEEANGPIPAGMEVLHHCDNPPCHELTHLFIGTQKANVADMATKGRGWWQRVTHCPAGHEYTPDNTRRCTRRDGTTFRQCVECSRARSAARDPEAQREYKRRWARAKRAAQRTAAAVDLA